MSAPEPLLASCSICSIELVLDLVAMDLGQWMTKAGGPRCPWCTRALDHSRMAVQTWSRGPYTKKVQPAGVAKLKVNGHPPAHRRCPECHERFAVAHPRQKFCREVCADRWRSRMGYRRRHGLAGEGDRRATNAVKGTP